MIIFTIVVYLLIVILINGIYTLTNIFYNGNQIIYHNSNLFSPKIKYSITFV